MNVRQRSVEADGTVRIVADLLDAGVLAMVLDVRVDRDRKVRLFVHGEPGAQLGGFEAWSDF